MTGEIDLHTPLVVSTILDFLPQVSFSAVIGNDTLKMGLLSIYFSVVRTVIFTDLTDDADFLRGLFGAVENHTYQSGRKNSVRLKPHLLWSGKL